MNRHRLLIIIYILCVLALPFLLFLDEHLIFQESSVLVGIIVLLVFCILIITILKLTPSKLFLAAVLTIPLWLYCAIRYSNHYGEQEGVRLATVEDKGLLYGRHYRTEVWLDPSCHERIYYWASGKVLLEFITQVEGCDDTYIDVINVSDQIIVLLIRSSSNLPQLLVRSTSGKWHDFVVTGVYKGHERHPKHIDMFFERFDYNAGSNAIITYRLSADGAEFKFDSQRPLKTPGCDEIRQIYESSKSGDVTTRYNAVRQIQAIGGPCVKWFLADFAYSDKDPAVRQLARQAFE